MNTECIEVTNWWRLANLVHLWSRYTWNTTVTVVAMMRRHDAAYSFMANMILSSGVSDCWEGGGGRGAAT